MEKQTVKELRQIAKQHGIRGYYKLRKGQLIEAIDMCVVFDSYKPHKTQPAILDSPVPNIKVPTLQPTAYEPLKILNKVTSHMKSFADWLISYVPESIKKPVNEKLEALKSTVSNLFGKTKPNFEIVESKTAIKGFTKQHTIDGRQGIDAETFLNTVRPLVVNLLEKIEA